MALLSHEESPLIKMLLIGENKTGKTRYALDAAEAGFNVLYFNGDVALPTLLEGSDAAKSRLYHMDVSDYIDESGAYVYRFADVMKDFTTTGRFAWNETLGEVFTSRKYESSHRVAIIRPVRMDENTLFVFDSWTAYCQSIKQWKAELIGVDLGEEEKHSRDMYAGVGNKATQTLVMIQKMRCHCLVIAHPDEYTKLRKQAGIMANQVSESNSKIEWVKDIPKSTSKPHAMQLGKHFTDVAWMEMKGKNHRIDFTPSDTRIAGGHIKGSHDPKQASFAEVVKAGGGRMPAEASMDDWLTLYGPGEYQPAQPAAKTALTPKVAVPDVKAGAAPSKVSLGSFLSKKG